MQAGSHWTICTVPFLPQGRRPAGSLGLDGPSTLQVRYARARLVSGLLCAQPRACSWKPSPLTPGHVHAPADFSSHRNSMTLPRKEAFSVHGRSVRERTGLEEADFSVLSPCQSPPARPDEPPPLPLCSAMDPAPLQSRRGVWWGLVGRQRATSKCHNVHWAANVLSGTKKDEN